jgi:general transcription factor 3C polypeptide 5 (transcription factor C subunit 1)
LHHQEHQKWAEISWRRAATEARELCRLLVSHVSHVDHLKVLEHHVGDSKLGRKENPPPEPVAGVSLRPNDPFAKKIASVGIETRNVLVKVTVPKLTGRKRKRGTNGPYVAGGDQGIDANSITSVDLLKRLGDNKEDYMLEAIGTVDETHRFRSLPDFQLRSSDQPIMGVLRQTIMQPDYDKLRNFSMDLVSGAEAMAFPAPPSFAQIDIPHRYEYQQAPGVVVVSGEDGNLIAKNVHGPARKVTWALPPDLEEVPQGPPDHIPLTSPDGVLLPRAVKQLQELMETRPLVTKRVALNSLPGISDSIFKEASQFVGYSFSAGPWRDTLIKYGIDPRKDRKYRFYQTLLLKVDKYVHKTSTSTISQWNRPERHHKDSPTSHMFDGKSVTTNGKIWQICDVTDPILHDIFQTENIRTECDVHRSGWFHGGTLAKARAIMKDKMKLLFAGQVPPEEDYLPIAAFPDELHKGNIHKACLLEKQYGKRVAHMANDVRAIAHAQGSHIAGPPALSIPGKEDAVASTDTSAAKDNPDGAMEPEPAVLQT